MKKAPKSALNKETRPFDFLFLLILCISIFPSSTQASRQTEKAERLDMVRQATGNTTSETSNGFRDRVDMIFSQAANPSVERAYVDANFPAQVPLPAPVKEEGLSPLLDPLKKEKSPLENDRGKMKGKDEFKSELNQPQKEKIQMNEETYQLMNEKIKKDNGEEARKKHLEYQKSQQDSNEEDTSPQKKSNLPLSLSNNPFYFSEESRHNFEEDKTVIISRLVQTGYTRLEAENLIGNASTPEEAILSLMQNESMKYGQAVELVGVSDQTPRSEEI